MKVVIIFIFVVYINRERRKKDAEANKELTEEDL